MKKHIVLLVATASAALVACRIQAGGTGGAQSPTPAAPAAPAAQARRHPPEKSPPRPPSRRRPAYSACGPRSARSRPGASPASPGRGRSAGHSGHAQHGHAAHHAAHDPARRAAGHRRAHAVGSGDPKEANFLGNVYDIPADSQKLPDLGTLKPTATLFAKELNVPTRQFAEGFPGVAKRTEWFAIRFEAPLTVATEGSYDLTTRSDDGAASCTSTTRRSSTTTVSTRRRRSRARFTSAWARTRCVSTGTRGPAPKWRSSSTATRWAGQRRCSPASFPNLRPRAA